MIVLVHTPPTRQNVLLLRDPNGIAVRQLRKMNEITHTIEETDPE
jgi:hypothetical protein